MAATASDSVSSPAQAPSSKRTIAELFAVTLLAGAMGGGFSTIEAAPPPAPPPAEAKQSARDTAAQGHVGNLTLYELPPVITNLAAPADTWIRLEVSIVFDPGEVAHPEVLGGEIAGDLLAYLRTMTVAELEGPIGLQNLRQDLGDRVAVRSAGKVSELIIRTLVVQ